MFYLEAETSDSILCVFRTQGIRWFLCIDGVILNIAVNKNFQIITRYKYTVVQLQKYTPVTSAFSYSIFIVQFYYFAKKEG